LKKEIDFNSTKTQKNGRWVSPIYVKKKKSAKSALNVENQRTAILSLSNEGAIDNESAQPKGETPNRCEQTR